MRGSYILMMKIDDDSRIRIGKLGLIDFSKGYYCYIGSALGKSINLENRIERHKKLGKEKSGKVKWHIDYFLVNPNTSIFNVVTIQSKEKMECDISRKIEKIADKSIEGFGCSDCDCKSHFHYFENIQDCQKILEEIL